MSKYRAYRDNLLESYTDMMSGNKDKMAEKQKQRAIDDLNNKYDTLKRFAKRDGFEYDAERIEADIKFAIRGGDRKKMEALGQRIVKTREDGIASKKK